jgi:curli production assembly/transport component CsgF
LKHFFGGVLSCLALWFAQSANASDLVYTPNNPSFGGNPNNGPVLMATASATKKHVEQSSQGSSLLNQTPLEQFNQTLERNVIGQLSSAAASKLIGPGGNLIPGTLSTANFTITIIDLGGGVLRVSTTDKITGSTTSFVVEK